MKRIKNIFLYSVGVAILFSCNKQISEKQPDPNDATTITPNLVLGTVLTMISGTTSEGNTGVGALGEYGFELKDSKRLTISIF